MFNSLLFVSLAPVFIIAFYIYNRDKYEKEPLFVPILAFFWIGGFRKMTKLSEASVFKSEVPDDQDNTDIIEV